MSESLPSTATSAGEKEKISTTSAHDTRQMGSDFSATIDFNKQNNPDGKPENPASPERPPVDEVSITTENPEVVAAALERERIGATQKLEAFDAGVAKTGKPLENSEFLDRAGLLEKSASLNMLSSQKKLALAETSPEAATPAGQAEIARLKEERKKAIEGLKAQFDAQLEETKKRAATELMAEDTDLSIVSAKRLIEGIKRQQQVRADLEAAGMTPEEVKAVVAEAVVESPEEKQGAAQGENIELAIAQLQVEGPEKNAPTEKPDDNLRVALLNFAEAVAAIAARSASPEEKSLFEAVLENIKKLSELGAAKVEKDAKISIREMLGVAAVSGGGQEVTSSALDRFTKGMEEDKKGKGGSFFKNLLGKIGQLSWVKKLKGLFGSAKSGLEGIPGITKLGLVGVKGRIEGLLAGQFGKLDLGKKLGAKKVGGAEGAPKRLDQVADENAKVFTAEENAEFRARIAAGEGAKAENAPEDLEGVRAKMQELNAKMDAYDKTNPGKQDSPESKAMEAEYAPLRARFDELNKTTQASEAPVRPTPKEVIDALEKQSGDETISLNEAETTEFLARFNKMREAAATEEAAKAGVTSPEAVRSPAVAVEDQPVAAEVSASAIPEEITSGLEGAGFKAAAKFNTETFASLLSSDTGAVDKLLAAGWEGVTSEQAETVKNRILYHTLTKESKIPDTVKPYILEALQKRGYLTYKEENGKYTFTRGKF